MQEKLRTGVVRLLAGTFTAAAIAVPLSLSGSDGATDVAQGKCLAHFGNIEDGNCLGYSNGNGIGAGTPFFGVYGEDGPGLTSGPLLPGTSINRGIN